MGWVIMQIFQAICSQTQETLSTVPASDFLIANGSYAPDLSHNLEDCVPGKQG